MARAGKAVCFAAALTLLLHPVSTVFAAAVPTTLPQLAVYQAADRDKILIEGAKKEAGSNVR